MRVHLGMPMCGARIPPWCGRGFALARDDAVSSFLVPFVESAVAEFPAALAAVRAQLPVDDGPVTIVGASLGGGGRVTVLAPQRSRARCGADQPRDTGQLGGATGGADGRAPLRMVRAGATEVRRPGLRGAAPERSPRRRC